MPDTEMKAVFYFSILFIIIHQCFKILNNLKSHSLLWVSDYYYSPMLELCSWKLPLKSAHYPMRLKINLSGIRKGDKLSPCGFQGA